uniref:Uncharacterized protein n=1 Tax=Arundo donax TaxID=35708 RepID=A0A0A9G5I6_ARUDO
MRHLCLKTTRSQGKIAQQRSAVILLGENTNFKNFCLTRSFHALQDTTTNIANSITTMPLQIDMV